MIMHKSHNAYDFDSFLREPTVCIMSNSTVYIPSPITGNNRVVAPVAEATAQVAQLSVPSGRRLALLIGISYRGKLLNKHQNVDRYRDVLIGTHRLHLLLPRSDAPDHNA